MNNFSSLIENSKQAVRYWWLLLIIGIALFAVGVLIFVYPAQSYLGMSLVFGWLMLISGILEVVLSSANKHFITGRGWMMAGGIIEIILGIILIFNVGLSAATLPIFLGFWLMMRGFSAIGLGGDMSALEIAGSGWTIFTGVLLLLCSLWILFQPLVIGTTAVIVWVGITLLLAGITAFSLALQLRNAHHCLHSGRCHVRRRKNRDAPTRERPGFHLSGGIYSKSSRNNPYLRIRREISGSRLPRNFRFSRSSTERRK